MGWSPGDVVTHQELWRDLVWAARPLTVVEDTADRLLLWLPHGTRRKVPMTPPSRPDPATRKERIVEMLDRRDWVHVEHVWDVSSLWILRPGDWHAVWVSWLPSGEHLGWYVNLQRPFRRTSIGIESMDLMLDVVAEPDLSWRWKDDDELDEILRRRIFDSATGERVRREAREVIDRIEKQQTPFDESWPAWRPDPAWTLPVLPDGWDDPSR